MKVSENRAKEAVKLAKQASSYFDARVDLINYLRLKIDYFNRHNEPDDYDRAHSDVYSELLEYLITSTNSQYIKLHTREDKA